MIIKWIAAFTLMALIAATFETQIALAQQKTTMNEIEINGYTVQFGSVYYNPQAGTNGGYNGAIRDNSGNVIGIWAIVLGANVINENSNMSDAMKYYMSMLTGVNVNSIQVESYIIDGKSGAIGSCSLSGSNVITYFAWYRPYEGVLCTMASNNLKVITDLVSTIHITSNGSSSVPQLPAPTPSNLENNQIPASTPLSSGNYKNPNCQGDLCIS